MVWGDTIQPKAPHKSCNSVNVELACPLRGLRALRAGLRMTALTRHMLFCKVEII